MSSNEAKDKGADSKSDEDSVVDQTEDGADIFTIEAWRDVLKSGGINEYDGSAFWVVDGRETGICAFTGPPLDGATGVHFYGK